jgi:acyl-CoA synthetase (NDP forming)
MTVAGIPGPRATGQALAQALLDPASVALVGVSDDAAKTSGRPLQFLRLAGFQGEVFNVNPARATVQGEPAYPTLEDLPRRPDQVFVLTGSDQAVQTVEQCGRLGVPVVTVLAGGFAESGEAGVAREQGLRDIVQRSALRLLGPSSIGVVNVRKRLMLTANAAFAEPGLPPGGILFASQSGSLIGALTSRGRARGVGFHSLVSVGGEVDLSIGEICAATLDDPEVQSYALFLESMRQAPAMRRFAEGAAARGKPVVAYKMGRSSIGAELAVSHTGSLAGDDELADAFMRDCGIVRVNNFEALIEALPLLQRWTRRRPTERQPVVGVVTTTGGGAAMVVDQLGVREVSVVGPSAATLARLRAAGVAVNPGRIVDLTLAGTKYEVMKATLDVMLSAPEFDLVVAAIGSSARSQPQLAVKPVLDSCDADTALACFIVPEAPEALLALAAAGIPNFRTPETCADVIAAVLARRRVVVSRALLPEPPPGPSRLLDEAQSYDVLARVGLPHAPKVVLNAQDAQAVMPFDGPVVVKLLHAEVPHKTDVGGVVLGVQDAQGLQQAIDRIRASLGRERPAILFEKVLVQPMCKGLAEVLIGFRRDPQIGPVVVLAAGGVLAEITRDRSLRLAPVTRVAAHDMITEVRSLQLLTGYRGLPRGDVAALAEAIVAMSRLALLTEPWVVEAEVNPLMVMPEGQGVAAADALVWLRDAPATTHEGDRDAR